MPWLLVDLSLVAIGLVVLALLALRLWRQVGALRAAVAAAGRRLGPLTGELTVERPARTPPDA